MENYKKIYNYLKKYPYLSAGAILFIILAGVFDGFSLSLLIPLLKSLSSSGNPLTNIPLINKFSFFSQNWQQKKIISFMLLFIFLMVLLKNIFVFLSNLIISKLRFSITKDLQINLFNQLIEYDLSFFDKSKSGHLANNLYNETVRIGNFINCNLNLIAVAVKILIYSVVLAIISWEFSIFSAVLILIISPFIRYIQRKIRNLGQICSQVMSNFYTNFLEVLNGIRLIKVVESYNYEKEKFKKNAENIYHIYFKNKLYNDFVLSFFETTVLGAVVLIFLVFIVLIHVNINFILPLVITYFVVLIKMFGQVNLFNALRNEALSYLGAFEAYNELVDKKDKAIIKSGIREIHSFNDYIEFKDLSFGYDQKEVLKDINLKILKGQKTALVGITGSGKTTLINLILRLYEPWQGDIYIDGISIKELNLKSWHKKIGVVSQDIFIFNASVSDNIAYGSFNAALEEVEEAAKSANADEFIKNLPNGYDTVLGERGVNLSGGERQRISIARAIISKPEILILDEATSSLDSKTENLIQEAINRMVENKTVIVIAHRLSTVKSSDKIIVLEQGRIVEEGNHDELIQKNEYYKKIYELQFGKN